MKLMISGSMTFAHDMIVLEKELKKLGHTPTLPYGIDPHLKDSEFTDKLEENMQFCIDDDVMMKNFKIIKSQDGILVFNKEKSGIKGYIGTSALMEMAIAYFLGKKIFIMYDLPSFNTHRWAHEVTIMQPVLLHGNLDKIK